MSDKVIQFPGKKDESGEPDEDRVIRSTMRIEDAEGYIGGPVRCISCKHEWVAGSPVGCFDGLECPECHLFTGIIIYPVIPDTFWVCGNCDSPVFTVDGLKKEIICWRCGSVQVWSDNT
jgi:hypothetical protein